MGPDNKQSAVVQGTLDMLILTRKRQFRLGMSVAIGYVLEDASI